MRRGLLGIQSFTIPVEVITQTISFLRQVGHDGFEGFVLWSGLQMSRDEFSFRTAIIPEQRALMTESGLLVTVEGKALFEVNRAVHAKGEILAAQVHSHPTEAYHSSTDDAYPMVTLVGSLSIVVPDFAKNAPADIDQWACYRLSSDAEWAPINRSTKIIIV